jgi:ribosomal protein L11 methyltransferase
LFQASLSDPEARVRRALAQVQVTDAALTIDSLADADWVRNTQALYQPIALGERLAIVPTWHDPLPGRICIRLDPGVAFGSGSHATTQLCLLWLEARVSAADSVIDYGTGSGVLAIAAARLGAKAVTATDIDPQALEAALYNAAQNRVQIALQAVDTPLAPADMLIANILTQPLLLLAPAFAAAVRPAGLLALSGILVAQADEVTAAYAPWFELAPWRSQEGWILLSGPRR